MLQPSDRRASVSKQKTLQNAQLSGRDAAKLDEQSEVRMSVISETTLAFVFRDSATLSNSFLGVDVVWI